MRSLVTKIIIVTSLSIFLISGAVLYFGFVTAQDQLKQISQEKEKQTRLLASSIERKFGGIINMLEVTASSEQFFLQKDSSMISSELKGVPQSDETKLRRIAQSVLDKYPEFDNVGFTLPNGDMYFLEPYPLQLQLENTNFAFRDWYSGVIRTNGPYLSEVFAAESIGEKTVKVAVPVNDKNKLVGIWGGILNLGFLDAELASLSSHPRQLIVLYDHNGNIVSSTLKKELSIEEKEAHYNYAVKALTGNSGYTIDDIGDEKFFVTYHPIKTGSLFWSVLVIEPYDVAFSYVNDFRDQIFIITGIITSIGIAAAILRIYFVKKDVRKTVKLQNENKRLHNIIRSLDKKYKDLESELVVPQRQSITITARHYLVAIVFALVFLGMINVYSFYESHIFEQEFGLLNKPIRTGYVIQNLRGDTVDTWLSWRLLKGSALTVNIVNPEIVDSEKLAAIKEAILSEGVIALDDSLLHKGPKGSISVYYNGWMGALSSLSEKTTLYYIPSNIKLIESAGGEGDVIIRLTDEINGDGYSGFTKSIADESQILKSTITIYDVDTVSPDELRTITRHEFGHAIGLAHSTAPEDLMAPVIQTDYPYISQCDLDALAALYDGSKNSQVVCEK